MYLPSDYSAQIELWEEAGITYNFEGEKINWTRTLLGFAPWLLLIAFWIFMIRRMQNANSGMNNVFSFGKSKAKMFSSNLPKVKFLDVAGCVEAKEELEEVILYLKSPKKFQKLGGKIPKGVLLVGPPGTGKTLLARAVAGEASVPFLSISGAEFVEMFVGVGASRVRDLFEQAKKHAPAIIFIDELDAVGRQRGAGLGGGHDEREQTLNQLLVELDGFENNHNVIVMAATNRPDVLDSALLRPGRFDRQVVVDIPDLNGRHDILKIHTKKIKINSKSVNLLDIAKGTPGMVGADLANLVNEAALLASRKRKKSVDNEDFEDAKDKVIMGVQRKSMILSEDEKKITAFNEITTGASNDIERATSIAKKMVCEWGMSDKLGPMSFGKKNEEIFLGREIQSHRDYSEKTAQDIDNEVVRIIKNAQKDSHKILKEKIDLLHLMANELLEHETIDEKDIKLLVKGKKLPKKEIS